MKLSEGQLEILFLLLELFGEFLLEILLSFFFEGTVELGGHSLKKARKKRHAGRVARAQAAGEPEPTNQNLSAGSRQ